MEVFIMWKREDGVSFFRNFVMMPEPNTGIGSWREYGIYFSRHVSHNRVVWSVGIFCSRKKQVGV